MTATHDQPATTPRWLHAWAVLTVCATLPLLLLGAEVTTKQVGMVDPQGFRTPWHMLTVPLRERGLGFVIEHSHRLAGFIVGTCIIVLAVGLWRCEPRRGVRWLGAAALAAVIVQGLLGGFRVQLNALAGRDLAFVHGLFAQLVFATLVSLAFLTSRGAAAGLYPVRPELRRLTLVVAVLVYLQIVFGALVRHTELPAGPRLHLFFAAVVAGAVVWLLRAVLESRPHARAMAVTAWLLVGLVAVQVGLGVEAWLARFAVPGWPQLRPAGVHAEVLRSIHYLVGALVFATAVVLTLQARLGRPWAVVREGVPAERLEGAA